MDGGSPEALEDALEEVHWFPTREGCQGQEKVFQKQNTDVA